MRVVIGGSSLLELGLALVCALLVAAVTTPVGVSGAVFLLPVQVSVLQVPSPAVTPTNLMFNLLATPGALMRYLRQGQVDSRLAGLLLTGTVPGVMLGAWLRVSHLAGEDVFRVLLALLLTPLGAWLLVGSSPKDGRRERLPPAPLVVLAGAVGVVGGLLGIGGGSLLAPMLAGLGLAMSRVAPAALLVTFATSLAGVATFALLAAAGQPAAAPEWLLGFALGIGGMAGAYLGARTQPRLDERLLRRLLGTLALLIGAAYAVTSALG